MDLYPTAVEPVQIPVAAPIVLDMPVSVALLPLNNSPRDTTAWVDGTWTGDPATERLLEVTLAGRMVADPPAGSLHSGSVSRRVLWLQFTVGAARPVRRVPGEINVR